MIYIFNSPFVFHVARKQLFFIIKTMSRFIYHAIRNVNSSNVPLWNNTFCWNDNGNYRFFFVLHCIISKIGLILDRNGTCNHVFVYGTLLWHIWTDRQLSGRTIPCDGWCLWRWIRNQWNIHSNLYISSTFGSVIGFEFILVIKSGITLNIYNIYLIIYALGKSIRNIDSLTFPKILLKKTVLKS